jgi:hypothetical protein
MDSFDRIEGAEKLIGVFGYWHSFHDAEVLWMRLDRRPTCDGCYGPSLETLIHASDLRNHALVHFRFHDVKGITLDGFNQQNMLHGLSISDIRGHQLERIRFEVGFCSWFGVNASLQCYHVEIVDVIPCTQDAAPLSD